MASVFFRGPKAAPRWYARYKDARGTWISRRVRQETRRDALRVAQALEAKAERQRLGMEAPVPAGQLCGPLMKTWCAALANRSVAQDRGRLANWLLPAWGSVRLVDVTLASVMTWLDRMRAAGRLSSASQRQCLNLLSRFLSWCVERGHAQANAVRQIPPGRRPQQSPKRTDTPWLQDDTIVRRLVGALSEPFNLMFVIGNRSALRTGEICGLRLSDVADVAAGTLRVRYSYGGPLKEAKAGASKTKWAPFPSTDAAEYLAPWIAKRKDEGAGPEALLFERPGGGCWNAAAVGHRWDAARDALGLGAMTWYMATRHSAASRWLSQGQDVDAVAAGLGHANPATTLAHYSHFVRKSFSPLMTAGIGGGRVIPITSARASEKPAQLETSESQVSHG